MSSAINDSMDVILLSVNTHTHTENGCEYQFK